MKLNDGVQETTEQPTEDRPALYPPLLVANSGRPAVSGSTTLDLSADSCKRLGDTLFVLWLKIVATVLAVRLMIVVWPVVVLLVLSLMLVATFNPLVRRLQNRLTRGYAITVVVFGLIVSLAGMLALMIPPLVRQANNLLTHLPAYLGQIQTGARHIGIPLRLDTTRIDISRQISSMGPETFNILLTILSGITGVITVAVLTTYLLIDGPRVATSLLGMLPRPQRLPIRQMFGEIGLQVGDYMRGQIITSGLAALFSTVLLLALGVPEPLALGFWMAVADIIPIVGPLIGTVPAVLMALIQGPTTALIVLIGYIIYHQIESHVLVPRIYCKTMKMTPSIIILSILIGATLMGIPGALLALPVAAAIPVVFRYIAEWRHREDEEQTETAPALP